MPTHIAHICLCLPSLKATQRQSQKSSITNALLAEIRNLSLNQTFRHK